MGMYIQREGSLNQIGGAQAKSLKNAFPFWNPTQRNWRGN